MEDIKLEEALNNQNMLLKTRMVQVEEYLKLVNDITKIIESIFGKQSYIVKLLKSYLLPKLVQRITSIHNGNVSSFLNEFVKNFK